MTNINDLLRQHIKLDVECLDRIYLNGYVPTLQVPGQLVTFMVHHRKQPVPSPTVLGQITDTFRRAVERFAEENQIPVVHFKPRERKDDIAAEHRRRFARSEGVVFIGVAQEKALAFKARKREARRPGFVSFDFSRQSVYVTHYCFYLQDEEFGPAFIKVCTYAPFSVKVCLNGHEWVKQQLRRRGVSFEPLDNGFLSCDQPQVLQETCDALGPEQIEQFFAKWGSRLPWPLTSADQQASYRHRLAIWQLEVSRTQVFTEPVHGSKRTFLVRSMTGRLHKVPYDVCVLVSRRSYRDPHPVYFVSTDLTLRPQQALQGYAKRWNCETDNWYLKQRLGLGDFRVQSYEAIDKFCAIVLLSYVYLQWRLIAANSDHRARNCADVIRQHRDEHAQDWLRGACQEVLDTGDIEGVLRRYLPPAA